jgi:hypothetical protein
MEVLLPNLHDIYLISNAAYLLQRRRRDFTWGVSSVIGISLGSPYVAQVLE